MDNWDEIRTAYQVVRLGTVSGAADVLGVHHATVIRHIDALESRLGVKLFQRHARGYTATEAGTDLFQVAQATDDQFSQLLGRIKGRGQGVAGDLIVTSIIELSPLLSPVLAQFQAQNPGLVIRYLTGGRLFRLEYGEAHVAIRAVRSGNRPEQPDNVVQPFVRMSARLVASPAYIARHGRPSSEADLVNHWFVGLDEGNNRGPFNDWLKELVPDNRIIYRVEDTLAMQDAIIAGAGIGFLAGWDCNLRTEMVEVIPQREHWTSPLWLITHVDLHRTAKVQAFLKFLKDAAKNWHCE
jgi:DNA-binding transcriptional LysR family regulator